jgi:hypothetical protein
MHQNWLRRIAACSVFSLLTLAGALPAQAAAGSTLAGCWEGDIVAERGEFELPVFAQFTQAADGKWQGTVTLPLARMVDYPRNQPFKSITVQGVNVSFVHAMSAKQDLLFEGTLSPDGNTLAGTTSGDGSPDHFELRRTERMPWIDQVQEVQSLSPDAHELAEAFNADAGKVRLVVPLSPSCPGCRVVAHLLQKYVLEGVDSPDLRIYVVWQGVFGKDNAATAREVSAYLRDPRVRQYWREKPDLLEPLKPVLGLTESPVFDVTLLYPRGVRWQGAPPPPASMRANHRNGVPPERKLNGMQLAEDVRQQLAR